MNYKWHFIENGRMPFRDKRGDCWEYIIEFNYSLPENVVVGVFKGYGESTYKVYFQTTILNGEWETLEQAKEYALTVLSTSFYFMHLNTAEDLRELRDSM